MPVLISSVDLNWSGTQCRVYGTIAFLDLFVLKQWFPTSRGTCEIPRGKLNFLKYKVFNEKATKNLL